jgi:predicted Zn-dependent peptidase
VLPNGVEFVAERVRGTRIAAIALRFKTGSRYESASNSGISHFVEHLLFKGTATRSSFDIALAFDTLGGYVNAYTDKECIVVYCVMPAEGAERALETMLDMALHSSLGKEEIELEREVILSEIITSHDDADEEALDKTSEVLWGKNSMALRVVGSEDTVSRLTGRQLRGWYDTYIARGSLSVFAAGSFNEEALRRLLEGLPPRKEPARRPRTPPWRSGFHAIPSPFSQELLFILFPIAAPVTEQRFYTLAVLNALLGDTISSRLFRRLREQSGLCYSVYSYNDFFSDCAFFSIYTSSARKNLPRIVGEISEEIDSLLSRGMGTEEIRAAQEHLCGEELISSEDMEYRVKGLMRNRARGFPYRTTGETLSLIRSVSPEDLAAEAARLFRPAFRADIVYGPKLSARVLKKLQSR